MSFNKDLPHTYEVFGVPGVKWEQGPYLYSPTGEIVVIKDGKGVPADAPKPAAAAVEDSGDGMMSDAELREYARISGVDGWQKKTIQQLRKELGS